MEFLSSLPSLCIKGCGADKTSNPWRSRPRGEMPLASVPAPPRAGPAEPAGPSVPERESWASQEQQKLEIFMDMHIPLQKYSPSSSKSVSTCSFGRLQLEALNTSEKREPEPPCSAPRFQPPPQLLFFHTCKWYIPLKSNLSFHLCWDCIIWWKVTVVYTRTREQKGADVSKILLRKARREQKGPSWTMKTTKALDWKRHTHAHQPLSSSTGSSSFTAAQTRLSTVRSKFRLIQNRITSPSCTCYNFLLMVGFLYFLQSVTKPNLKLR